jgi:hypothetical protein
MEAYKLRVRIGQHEFEAEGPQEAVERQFQAFSELVKVPASAPVVQESDSKTLTSKIIDKAIQSNGAITYPDMVEAEAFKKIFHVEGEAVSLTVLPRTETRDADAALVILLGCQWFTSSHTASGAQMIDNLRQSGISVERADRVLKPYIEGEAPLIITTGIRRGAKYRLTNQGVARAKTLAQEMASIVP